MKKICIFIFAIFASLFMMGKCYAISEMSFRIDFSTKNTISLIVSADGSDFKSIFGNVEYDNTKLSLSSFESPNSDKITVSQTQQSFFRIDVSDDAELNTDRNDVLKIIFDVIDSDAEDMEFSLTPIYYVNSSGVITNIPRSTFFMPYNVHSNSTSSSFLDYEIIKLTNEELLINLFTTHRNAVALSSKPDYDQTAIKLESVTSQGLYNYEFNSQNNYHFFPLTVDYNTTPSPYIVGTYKFSLIKQPSEIGKLVIGFVSTCGFVEYYYGSRMGHTPRIISSIDVDFTALSDRVPPIQESSTPKDETLIKEEPSTEQKSIVAEEIINPETGDSSSIFPIVLLLFVSMVTFVYHHKHKNTYNS